ncbi:branched-chain amino acid transport system II carrier protein [Shigella boydii]|nr:branched-chain amino acid transport system II carrier protein [Shigella boydii]
MVGLQAGEHVWTAAFGFLITAVGLPVLTVVALAKVGGGVDSLSTPIGKVAGVLLATVCYLAVGPLFATPRTATVSFEVGIAPLTGDSALPLFIYSLVYFRYRYSGFALSGQAAGYRGQLPCAAENYRAGHPVCCRYCLAGGFYQHGD